MQALQLLSLLSSFEPPSSKKLFVVNLSLYRIEYDNRKWVAFTPSVLSFYSGESLYKASKWFDLKTQKWRNNVALNNKLVSWKKLTSEKKKENICKLANMTWPLFFFSIRSCLQMLVTNIILVFKMTLAFTQFIPSRVDCVKTAHRCCIALFELLSGNCFCCHKLEDAIKEFSLSLLIYKEAAVGWRLPQET